MGCCRKYVSLLNGTNSGPIFSFAYFRDVIEEVSEPEIPLGYWNYVMPELEHLERRWLAQMNPAAGPAAEANPAPAAGPTSQETR